MIITVQIMSPHTNLERARLAIIFLVNCHLEQALLLVEVLLLAMVDQEGWEWV